MQNIYVPRNIAPEVVFLVWPVLSPARPRQDETAIRDLSVLPLPCGEVVYAEAVVPILVASFRYINDDRWCNQLSQRDVSRFRNASAFASWLGLCPENKISGGKVLYTKSRRVRSRVATALPMAANSLHHAKDYLGEFFRRITRKLGKPQAITATAHKLARIVYHLLSTRETVRGWLSVERKARAPARRTLELLGRSQRAFPCLWRRFLKRPWAEPLRHALFRSSCRSVCRNVRDSHTNGSHA
jgi:Transposase IS116/IS110/IS902 family